MADYMYHDYDGDTTVKSKKRKVLSIIGTTLCVLWFVAIGLYVAIRHDDIVRTEYPEIAFSTHNFADEIVPSGNCEFMQIKREFVDKSASKIVNAKLFETYPKLKNLLDTENANKADSPIFYYDENGYLTVAQVYVDYRNKSEKSEIFKGVMGVDVMMIPYETADNKLKISSPLRFCLKYDISDGVLGTLSKKEFLSESFRLNFYNIAVEIKGAENIDYTLNLGEYPTKSECDDRKIFNMMTVDDKTGILTDGNDPEQKRIVGTAKTNDTSEFVINFDERMYRKFESVEIGATENAQFSIKINKGVE